MIKKQHLQLLRLALGLIVCQVTSAQPKTSSAKRSYDIAAFLYPAYASDDPRLRPLCRCKSSDDNRSGNTT
jgi:hypothetical protein